jgi:hypothetical protein
LKDENVFGETPITAVGTTALLFSFAFVGHNSDFAVALWQKG